HHKINNKETLMNKDQIKGQAEEVKGKIEEAAGVILDDKSMQIEGNIRKNAGKAQSVLGDLKEAINDDN
ncbi:MAG: CsbD family protein, partial [Methylobacter sp.]